MKYFYVITATWNLPGQVIVRTFTGTLDVPESTTPETLFAAVLDCAVAKSRQPAERLGITFYHVAANLPA